MGFPSVWEITRERTIASKDGRGVDNLGERNEVLRISLSRLRRERRISEIYKNAESDLDPEPSGSSDSDALASIKLLQLFVLLNQSDLSLCDPMSGVVDLVKTDNEPTKQQEDQHA
jgi:hypothetical protein